ncbi:hypothetical protein EPH_0015860 [Eimeria praecox]|uniref:Uncharacterized protein n=1 Tax=Eimeria praecox TaxID=51316 RepID=U6H1Y6_9EIME|nr:hypothetical protein EPH_0015860 [Eimeria praecox]
MLAGQAAASPPSASELNHGIPCIFPMVDHHHFFKKADDVGSNKDNQASSTSPNNDSSDRPSGLGPEEVQSRIREMERLLRLVKEGEQSESKVDSEDGVLGHRLRELWLCFWKNEYAVCGPDVPEDLASTFKALVDDMDKTLKRNYSHE